MDASRSTKLSLHAAPSGRFPRRRRWRWRWRTPAASGSSGHRSMLEKGETVILDGRAGYESPLNRGRLTLTNRRLIWERSLSVDPFGDHELALSLAQVRACESRGDAIFLRTEDAEVFIFPQWWALSVL